MKGPARLGIFALAMINVAAIVSGRMVFFWGTTLVNLRGVQTSSWIGSVGTIAGSILLGPAKGMPTVAEDGYAHPRLARTRAYGVPVQLLIVQTVAGSIFALLSLFVPSVSTSYWMLSAGAAEIVIVMYALMFAAVIKLRYSQPDTPRPYRVPGGLVGGWLAGGSGLLGCIAAFGLGFIPPSQLRTGNPAGYVTLLALAVVVLSVPPFVLGVRSRAGRRAEPATAPAQ